MENNEFDQNTEQTNDNNAEQVAEQQETIEIIEKQPEPAKINWKKEVFEWAEAIVIAVVVALIIRNFIFTLVLVDGPSMENTLHTGDRLYVNRLGYKPHNGDIIVFTPENMPSKPFIKRVIATPGQTVDIDFEKGIVMVDGKILDEKYIKVPTKRAGDVKFPVTVPEGYFFAMGDNRGNSHDSRNSDVGSNDNNSGLVKNDSAMGKALFRVWPLNKIGSLY